MMFPKRGASKRGGATQTRIDAHPHKPTKGNISRGATKDTTMGKENSDVVVADCIFVNSEMPPKSIRSNSAQSAIAPHPVLSKTIAQETPFVLGDDDQDHLLTLPPSGRSRFFTSVKTPTSPSQAAKATPTPPMTYHIRKRKREELSADGGTQKKSTAMAWSRSPKLEASAEGQIPRKSRMPTAWPGSLNPETSASNTSQRRSQESADYTSSTNSPPKLQKPDARVAELQREIERLKVINMKELREKNMLRKDVEKAWTASAKSDSQKSELEKVALMLKAQLETLRDEKEVADNRLREQSSHFQKLKSAYADDIKAHEETVACLTRSSKDSQEMLASLTDNIKKPNDTEMACEKVNCKTLQVNWRESLHDHNLTRKELAEKVANADNLTTQLRTLTKTAISQQNELKELKESLKTSQSQHQEALNKIAEQDRVNKALDAKLNDAKKVYQEETESLKKNLENSRSSCEESAKAFAGQTRDKEKLEVQLRDLISSEIPGHKETIQQLQGRLKEMEEVELTKHKLKVDELEQKLTQLIDNDLPRQEEKCKHLEQELGSCHARNKEDMSRRDVTISRQQEEYKHLQQELTDCQARNKDALAEKDLEVSRQQEVYNQRLEQELSNCQARNKEALSEKDRKISRQHKEYKHLQQELVNCQARNKGALSQKDTTISRQQEAYKHLEQKLSNARNCSKHTLSQKNKELTEQQEEISRQQEKIAKRQQDVSDLRAQLHKAQDEARCLFNERKESRDQASQHLEELRTIHGAMLNLMQCLRNPAWGEMALGCKSLKAPFPKTQETGSATANRVSQVVQYIQEFLRTAEAHFAKQGRDMAQLAVRVKELEASIDSQRMVHKAEQDQRKAALEKTEEARTKLVDRVRTLGKAVTQLRGRMEEDRAAYEKQLDEIIEDKEKAWGLVEEARNLIISRNESLAKIADRWLNIQKPS